jgi:hypothetical protein
LPLASLANAVIASLRSQRRAVGFDRVTEEKAMSNNDWKRTLPFKRHWAVYLLIKVGLLALAAFVAWHLLRAFAVV